MNILQGNSFRVPGNSELKTILLGANFIIKAIECITFVICIQDN